MIFWASLYIWMQKCKKIVSFVISRHDLLWWQQDHMIFFNFFITLPNLGHNIHMWSVEHHRYCPLKFKKFSWLQILEIFLAAIFLVGTGGENNFSLKNGFALTKATLYLKMKKIWIGWYTKVPVLCDSYSGS